MNLWVFSQTGSIDHYWRETCKPNCWFWVGFHFFHVKLLLFLPLFISESDEDFEDLNESIRLVKEVIAAVDNKVNEHEKRQRLKEFHSRMDSKSIMTMKNKQMFAREDLLRRRLIHDGALQLKNAQGRLKGEGALTLFVLLFANMNTNSPAGSWPSRRPRSAAVRRLGLPPRERSEIRLCHAGTSLPSSSPSLTLSAFLSGNKSGRRNIVGLWVRQPLSLINSSCFTLTGMEAEAKAPQSHPSFKGIFWHV